VSSFVIKRLISLVPVAIGVVTIVFLLIHAIPGDPVDRIIGEYATEDDRAALRNKLGLNDPMHTQLFRYYGRVFRGDLGNSLIYSRPVRELIIERIGPTLELAIASILVALLISIPLGIVGALRAGSALDFSAMTLSMLGVAIPNFWLGPMLVLLFSVHWDLLPVSERGGWESYLLPAITLGTSLAAILARMLRNSILENLHEDHVRTARAKGLGESRVLLFHVLRNAATPVVTILGLQFGVLLTGAIITERIFGWPGLGTLILDGIGDRDYPVVQGCVLLFSATYLVVNLMTDLLYAILDPRIRLEA